MKLALRISLGVIALGIMTTVAPAAQNDAVHSPAQGVLCDQYFCADQQGISNGLTAQYVDQAAADKLAAQGDFDRKKFTYSNGIFCDVAERRCHENRYSGPNGKRSRVSLRYTSELFGRPFIQMRRPHN